MTKKTETGLTIRGWEIERDYNDRELLKKFIELRDEQLAILGRNSKKGNYIIWEIRDINKCKKFSVLLSIVKTIDDNLKADDFEDVLMVAVRRGWKSIISKLRKYL